MRQEFWLFGGRGIDGASGLGMNISQSKYELFLILFTPVLEFLNDLWRYRMNDSAWTWISGSNTANQPGVYGEKGIPSRDNYPGARYEAFGCYDSLRQEFWLFGGHFYADTSHGLYIQRSTKLFTQIIQITTL